LTPRLPAHGWFGRRIAQSAANDDDLISGDAVVC
jgi:hypothetical protein